MDDKLEQRPYQQRIIEKTLAAFEKGMTSVLIESPCGSGKTAMALSVAKVIAGQDMKIGWVALRRNLLKQAKEENDRYFGIKNIEYISLFQNDLPNNVDCLILDECHHVAAPTCVTLLNRIRPKSYLGVTATPFRTDRMQLSFQKVIKDCGIHLLIQQGYLAPYQHFVIPQYNPAYVAETYAREPERWGKSLIFFLTVDECYRCQKLLMERGIKSEVVTAVTDRDDQIERFEKGEIPVLINVFVLTEGFNCCPLRTVFIRPSTRGPSIQAGGRVFRKHESKPFAQIVQSANTKFSFSQKVKALQEWTWFDGQWHAVSGNENVAVVQAMSLRVIANATSIIPAYLTKNQPRRRRRMRDARGAMRDARFN
jgi:superfamily II DNA or RNA helicase